MSPTRNPADALPGHRPLTARSVLASALLGEEPPRLPVAQLVRLAAAFGINENRARVALSRMAANHEVRADGGSYELVSPALLARQTRLRSGRAGATRPWTGAWLMAVIAPDPASAGHRSNRRQALQRARLGEYRDGVWVRPDNLQDPVTVDPDVLIVRAQTLNEEGHSTLLRAVERMWDLAAWQKLAVDLTKRLDRLDPTNHANLAPCFELSAACLRHFQADPLLPSELLPPAWAGNNLRSVYRDWDRAYRATLRTLR